MSPLAYYLLKPNLAFLGQSSSVYISTVVLIVILALIIEQCIDLINRLGLLKTDYILFQLKLPKSRSDEASSDETIFMVFNNLLRLKKHAWLFPFSKRMALEIVSSNKYGLIYLAYLPSSLSRSFISLMYSAMPGIEIKKMKHDPLSSVDVKIYNFKTIKKKKLITDSRSHTSFNLVVAAMTKISNKDQLVYQVIFSPSNANVKLSSLTAKFYKFGLRFSLNLISNGPHTNASHNYLDSNENYRVTLRLATNAPHDQLDKVTNTIHAAISAIELEDQKLIAHSSSLNKLSLSSTALTKRLPLTVAFKDIRLSRNDLALLFPLNNLGQLSQLNILEPINKSLAMPLPLCERISPGIRLGINKYDNKVQAIGLSESERMRHIIIVGATGSGKTTLMKQSIMQDIDKGRGLAVLDPHGDLAEDIIKCLPKKRIKDVIYFNPSDISHPIGLNILELDSSLKGDDLILAKDYITEAVISIMRKLFATETSAHRLEHVLRNAVQTAFYTDNPTLFTVYRLLNDTKYRAQVVNSLNDNSLKSFWVNEYGKAGDMQRVKLSFGLTSKLGRFLRSAATRRILGQTQSTIDFDNIMNSNKILICNLAKGRIGEDSSSLIGSIVLAKLQLTAYNRQSISSNMRQSFYLYVDEFQNFATPSFIQMLSEARKYGIALTLAEQSISQQADTKVTSVLLANVGTLVCFRCSSPMDEKILLPLFALALEEGDLMNLASYHFYIRLNAVEAYRPFTGETILETTKVDNKEAVINSSRSIYTYSHKG